MHKRYRQHRTAPVFYVRGSDDLVRCPVAAFHEYLRLDKLYQRQRSVAIEPCDQGHRFERCHQCHAVSQCINWPLGTFAEATHRFVAVKRNEQTGTQCARLCEVSCMSAMQEIKDAVGEDQRPCQLCKTRRQTGGLT